MIYCTLHRMCKGPQAHKIFEPWTPQNLNPALVPGYYTSRDVTPKMFLRT